MTVSLTPHYKTGAATAGKGRQAARKVDERPRQGRALFNFDRSFANSPICSRLAGYLQYLQITMWTYGTAVAAAAATVPSSHSLLAATTTTRLTICTAVQ